MKKFLLPLSLLVASALAVSACGVSATSDAASVDGQGISISTLNQTVTGVTTSAPFSCLVSQQGAIHGSGVAGTYSAKFVAQQLSLLVQEKVIAGEVNRLHLTSSSIAATLAQSQLAGALAGQSGSACSSTGAQVLASLPASYAKLLLNLQLDQDLVSAHLAGATLSTQGIAAYTATHPGVTSQACVSVILVSSKSAADGVETKLHAGASFSAIAKTTSVDSTSAANGGALGCVYPGQFTGSLSNVVSSIAVNSPSAPIAFQSDFVILEVTQRHPGTGPEAALAIVSSQTNAESAFMLNVERQRSVWINSQYGSWRLSSGQLEVVNGSGPKNSFVLNPNAVTPSGDTYK